MSQPHPPTADRTASRTPQDLPIAPREVRIEPLQPADWPEVAAIYAEGIATGDATFQTAPPTWEQWDHSHLAEHRLVARSASPEGDGHVLAWAALAPVSDRCVYAGVAEDSIYVAARARGQGIGQHHGRWRDVLLLERRSTIAGL